MPTTTPKVARDILAALDPAIDAAIRAAHRDAANGLKGADLTRILIGTGHLPNEGKGTKGAIAVQGLKVRTYMRAHGAWVGQGRTYGMTVAEARRVVAGFLGNVAPPAGVRYRKGQVVQAAQDGATRDEVASAA